MLRFCYSARQCSFLSAKVSTFKIITKKIQINPFISGQLSKATAFMVTPKMIINALTFCHVLVRKNIIHIYQICGIFYFSTKQIDFTCTFGVRKNQIMPSVFSQYAKRATISGQSAHKSPVKESEKEGTSHLFQPIKIACALFLSLSNQSVHGNVDSFKTDYKYSPKRTGKLNNFDCVFMVRLFIRIALHKWPFQFQCSPWQFIFIFF